MQTEYNFFMTFPAIHLKKNLFASIFLCMSLIFAQNLPIKPLMPESKDDLADGETEIILKTSRKKAQVYINGEFSGLTPLLLKDLIEGTYSLKIISGSQEQLYELNVLKNFRQYFYIELEQERTEQTMQKSQSAQTFLNEHENSNSPEESDLQKNPKKYRYRSGPLSSSFYSD